MMTTSPSSSSLLAQVVPHALGLRVPSPAPIAQVPEAGLLAEALAKRPRLRPKHVCVLPVRHREGDTQSGAEPGASSQPARSPRPLDPASQDEEHRRDHRQHVTNGHEGSQEYGEERPRDVSPNREAPRSPRCRREGSSTARGARRAERSRSARSQPRSFRLPASSGSIRSRPRTERWPPTTAPSRSGPTGASSGTTSRAAEASPSPASARCPASLPPFACGPPVRTCMPWPRGSGRTPSRSWSPGPARPPSSPSIPCSPSTARCTRSSRNRILRASTTRTWG